MQLVYGGAYLTPSLGPLFFSTMGTKRKATKPAVDFTKTKQKLGKGKQAASNATDTSFRAKAIAMPQQSILLDRSHQVTTRRRQTLSDLVQHTHHPSPGVRKDAVMGMLELVKTYAGFLELHCAALINAALPLLGDDDVHVRGAVATYFGVLLDRLDDEAFAPFAPSMLLLTTSAMSHISMAVRIDALRVLSLLLDKVPALATEDWESALDAHSGSDRHGQRLLQAFFAMLGVAADAHRQRLGLSTASTASVELGTSQRLRILRALGQFLSVTDQEEHGMWCFQSAFASPSDLEHFEGLFQPSKACALWTVAAMPSASSYEIHEALLHGATSQEAPASAHERLVRILHPSLLSTLLDALPSVMSPDGHRSDAHAELAQHILQVYLLLWRRTITSHLAAGAAQGTTRVAVPSLPQLSQLLTHLAPYFAEKSEMLHLHVIYCELVALYTVATQKAHHLSSVPFLLDLLSEPSLSPALYEALLPTFWLVVSSPMDGHTDVMAALLTHFDTLRDRTLQAAAFRFLARLAMLPTYKSLQANIDALYTPLWNTWILSLPRVLWQAATWAVSSKASPAEARDAQRLVEDVLTFLRWIALMPRHPFFDHAHVLNELAPRLTPLFHVQHPQRGPIPGPYHKWPVATQHLAQALTKLVSSP